MSDDEYGEEPDDSWAWLLCLLLATVILVAVALGRRVGRVIWQRVRQPIRRILGES